MSTNDIIGVVLQSISAILSIAMICFFLIKARKSLMLYFYIVCQIDVALWAIIEILQAFTEKSKEFALFTILAWFPVCFIGMEWLIFCFLFTKQNMQHFRKIVILLAIVPVAIYISILTNDYHHLFFIHLVYGRQDDYGILFWVQIVFMYSYIAIGVGMLIKYAIKQFAYVKKQSIMMIFAALFPSLVNLANILKILPSAGFDLTTVCFSFSLLLFAIATFKYSFLNIIPIALHELLSNLRESIIVIDMFNNIIFHNQSFTEHFGYFGKYNNNENICSFVRKIKEVLEPTESESKVLDAIEFGTEVYVDGELKLEEPTRKYYYTYVQPILSSKKDILGRVISFGDVSNYKRLHHELDVKNSIISSNNEELTKMNEELTIKNSLLKDYADTVESLAVANERNRLAREVHDTVGHAMTLIITLTKVSKLMLKKGADEAEKSLNQVIDIAVGGLKELRASVAGLRTEKLVASSIIKVLGNLAEESKNSAGIEIEFSAYGEEHGVDSTYSYGLYKICQEAITNSIRHGSAGKIDIILKFTNDKIQLFIVDDGIGCKNIKRGFGLIGMEERVTSLKGSISYGSSGDRGFNIHVEIPIGVESKND